MTNAEDATVTVKGQSGTHYRFEIYSIDTLGKFPDNNVVYMFTKRILNPQLHRYRHVPIYVGQSGISKRKDKKPNDTDNRLTRSHPKIPCIRKEGGTHICVYSGNQKLATEDGRRTIESDLIASLNPPCNKSK